MPKRKLKTSEKGTSKRKKTEKKESGKVQSTIDMSLNQKKEIEIADPINETENEKKFSEFLDELKYLIIVFFAFSFLFLFLFFFFFFSFISL